MCCVHDVKVCLTLCVLNCQTVFKGESVLFCWNIAIRFSAVTPLANAKPHYLNKMIYNLFLFLFELCRGCFCCLILPVNSATKPAIFDLFPLSLHFLCRVTAAVLWYDQDASIEHQRNKKTNRDIEALLNIFIAVFGFSCPLVQHSPVLMDSVKTVWRWNFTNCQLLAFLVDTDLNVKYNNL